jgi:vacuolar-type H+-ATPase subunit I/STV1
MDLIDFLIGMTLMNAMPHFILGTWKARMFSAFGFGDTKNILYGILNFLASLALFVYKYGIKSIAQDGIYAGALALLLVYFLSGWFWYSLFHQKYYENAEANLANK